MTQLLSLPQRPPRSRADWVKTLPPAQRKAYLARIAPTQREQATLLYQWKNFWARPEQLAPPGDWDTWLILAGRGFGKTRTGAEWVREEVAAGARRFALVARTAADARDVMVEGESGILAISPSWNKPKYEPSKRRLTWPNGAIATTFSADEPNLLRGPQFDRAWGDETAAWRFGEDAWDNLQFGLRLGKNPKVIVTTTPRPTPLMRSLLKDPRTRTTRGSTYDNAGNLAPRFLRKLLSKYEGTRIGRQEIHAELLEDTPGALWQRDAIEALRLRFSRHPVEFLRVVVAVDPATTSGEDSAETGILVVALGLDGLGYVLEDASGQYSPAEWGAKVLEVYLRWNADRVVAEVNQGGDLVESNMRVAVLKDDTTGKVLARGENLPISKVHASKGKRARAEPVSALYEQKRVRHVGAFAELEDQLCGWSARSGEASPDRLDALVWGFTELMLGDLAEETAPDNFFDLGDDRSI